MTDDELEVYESFAHKGGTASSTTILGFVASVRSAQADALAHRLRCEQLERRIAVLERASLADVATIREQRELGCMTDAELENLSICREVESRFEEVTGNRLDRHHGWFFDCVEKCQGEIRDLRERLADAERRAEVAEAKNAIAVQFVQEVQTIPHDSWIIYDLAEKTLPKLQGGES